MNGYLNTIILTVIACQAAQLITHNTESYKRIVHMMCALVLILTIARPIGWVIRNIESAAEYISGWKGHEQVEAVVSDPMEMTAQAVMEHAVQAFDLESDGMKATLVTDDAGGKLTEIQLFVKRCSYADRERAAAELTKLYGIPVYIYSDRSE